ncbi:MAG TPA: aldehyde dehydrogenase family protein [Thermoleophilaceae bacterium]|nr:aldehyde dehydrogenase family protein [Thermoleophilaceae bacterium]
MATIETPSVQLTADEGSRIAVENPATGQIIGHVPDMGAAEVKHLVEVARAAQPAWSDMGFEARAKVLYRARKWMIDNRDRVVRTIVEETGKTPEDALLTEVFFIADSFGYWAKTAPKHLKDEKVRSHSPLMLGKKLMVRYQPRGVIGVIGPWNYPLTNCFGDGIAALAAGNGVVFKPSEVTPFSTMLMQECMREAGLPDGLMQVATGRGGTGAALIEHVDYVMFTGSVATGKKVAMEAAKSLKPHSLELGGKDPMIVLRDADLERAANGAVYWGMANGGQICQAVERVYVEEPVYDEFVNKVVEKTRALRQGPPGQVGDVEVGAVTFEPQLGIIEDHLKDAVDKGAKVLVGGKQRESEGRFWEPTVVVDVDHSMKLMQDETFGPVLPVMKVHDEAEALRLANDSRYGLNSSVWTKDLQKGERIASQIQAGSTCVNDAVINYGAQELPFGGVKESGIGARHSAAGIRKYCNAHAILVTRFGMKREMYWFPFSKRNAKLLERLMVLMYGREKK